MAMRRSCSAKPPPGRPSSALRWWSLRSKRFLFRPWEARPMRNILLIARREYLEQVRGRAFKMTTFGVPAVFAAIVGVGYLSSLGLGSGKHLAVASNDPALAIEVRQQLLGDKEAKATVDVVAPASEADRTALVDKVKAKSVDGVLW